MTRKKSGIAGQKKCAPDSAQIPVRKTASTATKPACRRRCRRVAACASGVADSARRPFSEVSERYTQEILTGPKVR